MKRIISLLLLLISTAFNSSAQEMPLVYEVENTGADCSIPYLPSLEELPAVQALPDPFEWSDGRGRISNYSDWRYRRAEIKAEIENYEIGIKPDRPENITASFSEGTLTVNITVNGNTLTLTSAVVLPSGNGPFPAVIGMGGATGSLPTDIFTSRNIAQITFNFGQVMAHTQTRGSEPINKLYPDLTYIGAYSAWSWGVSRLIDGLKLVEETLPIDLKHLAVTGCSFAGKMALFAGAFDERIALTISQESGGGGYTTWRVSETLGNVETLGRTSHAWFIEDMFKFSSSVSKLPYDHHELMAMVAPRALLVLGNPDYEWLADESGYVGSKAAHEIWKALGVADRFGFSIVGGHGHCALPQSQKPEVEAFVEKFLLGNESANTNVATTPYSTNLVPWITWNTPALSNGASYFGKTTLISPSNLQNDIDTIVTLKWNALDGAQKYFIQLSTDPTFKNIDKNDSTITDTLIFYNDLLKGKKYYWRIQIKSDNGLGPWSDVWNFTTAIPLPEKPQLISSVPYSNRADYVTFNWNKVEYASSYFIQLSTLQSFVSVKSSASTQDTTAALSGTEEGKNYYWRVQARNISGSSQWSDISNFTLILPPTNLELQSSASNEITLLWVDNSNVEDGYIIERKQSPETSFTVIDTLVGSGNEYIDNNVDQIHNYTYRVKAYKGNGESDYSNETSLNLVGVNEVELTTEFSMSQNYPNPFNPSTIINYQLPVGSNVQLIVYDSLGKEVSTLVNEYKPAGKYNVSMNDLNSNLSSGIYFYTLKAGDFIQTKKMAFIK